MRIRSAELWFKGRDAPTIKLAEVVLDWSDAAVVFGPSGSGKTSLFRLICGWYPAGDEVSAKLDADFDPFSEVRFVGGHPSLLPWLTVLGNLQLAGGEPEDRPRLEDDLKRLCLDLAVLRAYPYELSHGMYKRIEILGAVRSEPRFLLLDEFFTSLDTSARHAAFDFLESEMRAGKVLIATHDLSMEGWERLPRFKLELAPLYKTVVGLQACED